MQSALCIAQNMYVSCIKTYNITILHWIRIILLNILVNISHDDDNKYVYDNRL